MSLIQEALKRQQEEEKKSAGAGQIPSEPTPTEEQGAPEILPGISAPKPSLIAPAEPPITAPAPALSSETPASIEPPPASAPKPLPVVSAPKPPPVSAPTPAPVSSPTPAPSPLEVALAQPEEFTSPAEETPSTEGAMSSRVPSVFLQGEKKKKSSLPVIIGILVLLAILAGGAFFFMRGEPNNVTASQTPDETAVEVEPVSTDTQDPVDPTEDKPAAQNNNDTIAETPTSGQVNPTSVKSLVPEPKPRALWPSLTLSGVMGKGKKGSAIINGEFLGIGDTIEGVKILSVKDKSVNLSYMGETQSLEVGNTTM